MDLQAADVSEIQTSSVWYTGQHELHPQRTPYLLRQLPPLAFAFTSIHYNESIPLVVHAKPFCHSFMLRWLALLDKMDDPAFLLSLWAFAPLNNIMSGHKTALFAAAFIFQMR